MNNEKTEEVKKEESVKDEKIDIIDEIETLFV